MAEANRDTLIDVLERDLKELKRRKGPHSIIAKTLEDALLSGTHHDLVAGHFACTRFSQHCVQLTLAESRKQVHPSRPHTKKDIERASALESVEQTKKDLEAWAKGIEKRERALPRKTFGDSCLPDGIDFSRHDPLSTRTRRHLVAKAPRLKKKEARAARPTSRSPESCAKPCDEGDDISGSCRPPEFHLHSFNRHPEFVRIRE